MFGPEKMITIPPRHYCIIENPVVKGDDEKPVVDENGQIKLLHADQVHLTKIIKIMLDACLVIDGLCETMTLYLCICQSSIH